MKIPFAKSRLGQIFRHRIYLKMISLNDYMKDKIRGVNTQTIIELEDLSIDSHYGSRYETVSYSKLEQIFEFVKKSGYKSCIDIGSGLGRPLIVAKEKGFNNLYGVDISKELINLSKENFQKLDIEVQLFCSDVDNFNFHIHEKDLIVFLFNPFGERRMKKLIKKLKKRDSNSIVIYHNPKHLEPFNGSKQIKQIKQINWDHFGLYPERVNFYKISSEVTI